MELHMDQIATELHLDPLELRLRNIVAPYTVDPYSGFNVGNAGIRECLLQGAEAIGWTHREPSADDRYRIGYGLACCAHKNGILGSFGGAPEYSSMILKMNDDGTLILNTGVHDMGCGTVFSMAKIVAEVLDVAPQNIQVLEGDTQAGPYDFGTYGSRVTYVSGAGAYYAAMAMKKEMLETAAQLLAVEPEQLQLRAGQVVSVSDAHVCMNYQQLAARAMFTLNRDLLVKYSHIPSQNPSSYAAHFAKVMVDQYTGLVKVIDYVAAHDVGVAINPLMVEAQIQGGVQMGIGYALQEEIQYNRDGTNKTAGFRNYHLCNAPDMPDVRVVLVEKGEAGGPFGAKGVGEVATVPVAAAVVNAVNNALSSN
ncbi:MAG: molybdopterin cofactor-binding domain-containing protein, partial [Clostridiales bacterium]